MIQNRVVPCTGHGSAIRLCRKRERSWSDKSDFSSCFSVVENEGFSVPKTPGDILYILERLESLLFYSNRNNTGNRIKRQITRKLPVNSTDHMIRLKHELSPEWNLAPHTTHTAHTLGSFKMQRCRGIPPSMFLTRPKTYEKTKKTRIFFIFRIF